MKLSSIIYVVGPRLGGRVASVAAVAGLIAAVGLASLAGVVATADRAEAQSEADTLFRRLDVNGDGFVTLVDLEILAERRVAHIDQNGDGRITRGELRTYEKRWAHMRASALLVEMDKNRDGAIVVVETVGFSGFDFRQADKDGDGRVTKTELATYFELLADRRATQIFVRFDTDKDGVISRAERSAMNRARFKQLDADGDGRVTKAEVGAALNRWLTRRPTGGAREASDDKPVPPRE